MGDIKRFPPTHGNQFGSVYTPERLLREWDMIAEQVLQLAQWCGNISWRRLVNHKITEEEKRAGEQMLAANVLLVEIWNRLAACRPSQDQQEGEEEA
jgi:hypothetical protein